MNKTAGSLLKDKWMEMSEQCFEPLTFGELEVGQKFICLPCPGDNHGHGGFRGTHHIFTKTHEIIKTLASVYAGNPTGRAMNNSRQTPSDFPHSMFVIRIE